MPENDYTTNIYAVVKERYGDKMTTTPEQFKEKMQDDNYAKNIYAVVKEKYGDKFTKTPEEFKAQFVSTPTDTTPIPTVKLDPIQVQHPDLKPIPKEAADAMMNSFTKMPKDLVDNPIYRNVFYNTFAKKLGLDAAVVKQYGERGIVENLIMDADNRIHNGENNPELLQYVAKLHRSIGNEKQANEAEALSYQMMADAPVGGGSFQDNGSTTDGMSGRRFATTSFGFSGKNGFTLEKNEKGDVIPIANNQPTQNSEYLNNIATAVENIGTAGLKHFVIDPAFHAIDEGQKYREEAKQFAKEGNNLKAAIHEVVGNGLMLVGLVSASTPAGAAGMAAFTGGTEAFPVLEKGLMPVSTFRNWASEQVHKLGPEFKAQADIIDDVITKDVATGLDFMWMAFLHGKGKEAIADVKDAKAYTETMKRGQPSTERMSKMFAKTFKEMTPSELYDFKQKTLERSQERAAKGLTEEESLLDVKNNIAQEMTQLNGMANEIPTTLEHPYKPVQQPEVLKNLEPSQPVVMNGKDGILKINPQGEWQFHSSDGGEPVTVKAKPTKEGEPAQTLTDMGISIPHIMSDWQASAEMSLADFIGETKVDGKDVTVIQGKAGDHVLRKLPSGEYEAMFETRTPENEKQLKKLKLDAINQAREAEGLEPKTRLNENYAKEPEPPEPTPTEDISAKKADIEKRRQEELKQNFKLELSSVKPLSGITTLGNLRDAILQAEKEGALLEDINKLKTAYNNGLKINAKYDAELKALEDNISVTNDKTQTNGKESSQSQSGEKAQENVLVTDNGTELKGSTTLAPTSEPVSPNAGESVVVNGKEVLDITPDATKVPPPDSPIERTDSPSGTGGDVASIKVDNQKSERPNLSRLTPDEMTVEIKKDIPTAVKNSQRTTTRVLEGGKSELSQQEVIELVVARADMNNRMSKLLAEERTLENKENKTPDEIQRLEDVKTDLSTIDAEILNFEKVAYQTGLDMSRAFAARKLLLNSQYDLLYQERVWQKELDRPPTKAESDALKDKIKRVKELEKEVQDLTIKHEAETKQAVFDAVKAAVEKLNKQKPEGKLTEEQLKAKAERKARKEQLWKEAINESRSQASSGFNISLLTNKKFLEYAKLAVEDAASDFRRFSKDMIDRFGKEIKDHLKKIYKDAGGEGEIYDIKVVDDKLKLPQQLIRDLVNEGADTPEKLTEAIKKEIPEGLDVTTEQIEAAWSDYGREVNKTKEQLQQDISSLKKLKRLEQELADAKAGKKNIINKYVVDPLKNVVSPSNKESITERNKTAIKEIEKQIKQEMQNNPAYEGERVDSKIQSLQDRIDEIDRKIAEEEFTIKQKEPSTNPEVVKLEKELEERQKKFQELKDKANGKEKVVLSEHEKRVKSLEDSISKVEEDIKNQNFAKTPSKTQPSNPKIRQLEAKLKGLRDDLTKERQKFRGTQLLTPEQKQIRIEQRAIDNLREKIKNKKYVPSAKKSPLSTPLVDKLRSQKEALKKQFEAEKKAANQNLPIHPEVRRLQNIDAQIARVQERINKKQYTPKPKEEPPTSKAIREKELELYKAKEKFKTDIEVAKLNSQSKLQKAGHLLMDIANTSRAIKASGDLSFPGRQGLFLAPAYPRIFARAFRDMITKDAASTKKYDEFMHQLMTDPKYSLIKKSGLELSRLDAKESAYEETSRGQMLYRIEKGVGDLIELSGGNRKYNPISPLSKIFRGSNQAYSGFANRLRVGVFMDGAEALAREGITDPKQLKAWAKIVNASSGRGNIQLGDVTSSVFFSARFQYSRLELLGRFLDPNTSAKVKMLHLKNTVKYALSVAAALEIARLALQNSGVNASVETNPESSDYGLLRVGNSRIDLTAGLAPWIRLTTKLATGKKKDSDTGIITDIDKINESLRFARSKTSPVVGNAISAITGKDFLGNPTTVLDQTKDLLAPAPMTAQLAYEAFDKVEMPEWTALVLLSTFGIGASNYEKPVEQQALTVKKSSGDMKVRQLAGIYLTNDPEKKKAFMQELGRTGVNVENTDWNKVSIDLQQHGISKENADGIKNDMRLEYSRARDMKAIKNEKEIKRLEKVNEKIDELLHPNFIQKNLTPGELPIVQSVLGKDETWEWDAEFGRLFKKAIEDLDLPADTYDKYKNAYDIAKHKKVE